jgi:hypothetical protein
MRLIRLFISRTIKTSALLCVLALALESLLISSVRGATATSSWEQPAASLADQIASILGPGQAHLTIHNLSTIANDEVPAIRRLIEQELRTRGVTSSTDEAANILRVTLSENTRERLWIAEVIEGTETKTVMVRLDSIKQPATQTTAGISLHKQQILIAHEPILAALEASDALVILEPENVRIYAHASSGWTQQTTFQIRQKRPLARDPRGILIASAGGQGFEADVPGTHCSGEFVPAIPSGQWTIHCHESDDPWPIPALPLMQIGSAPAPSLKAFYNATRDYYTGVVAPSAGVDLPPFYAAAWIPRSLAPALLINGIDGKFQLIENAAPKPIEGTRDWGSDFAALLSSCGSGTQIIASGSGAAAQDSLRAYDIPALEAVPVSPPLAMDGSIAAIWTAPGGRSLFAVVRTQHPQGLVQYEVDHVTATCN